MAQPAPAKPCACVQQHAIHVALVLWGGCPGEGQRGWPRVEVEQAIAQTRLVVVVPLGLRGRHDLDLARVQPKAFVDRANLRLGGLRIREKDPTGAAFNHRRCNARILDVGQRLRGEHDADILLAQRLEPLANAGGEHRVIEEQPLHRGSAAWARRRSVHRSGRTGSPARPAPPPCCASVLPSRSTARRRNPAVGIGIQQLAVGTAQHIGRKRRRSAFDCSSTDRPVSVRCSAGAPAKLPSADQIAAFSSGPMTTPSCNRRPSTHSAARAVALGRCGPMAEKQSPRHCRGRNARRPARGWWRASSGPCRRRRCASRDSGETALPAWRAAPTCPCRLARRPACGPHRRCASPAGTASRHRCG